MKWQSFDIHYDTYGCNLDHNGEIIYMHAMPSDQTELFDFAHLIEDTAKAAGIPINHPRKSKFHMTLARVKYDYPVDEVVQYFLDNADDWNFGSKRLSEFVLDNDIFTATDT